MSEPIVGFATADGTQRFAERFEGKKNIAKGHFRRPENPEGNESLILSSLGVGTYLGEPSFADDELMTQAVVDSVSSGAVNVIDTAINYRYQCSERSVGRALQILMQQGFKRDELFVATKNGFITPDASVKEDFQTYFKREFVDTGIVQKEDLASGMHCMSPRYLNHQLNKSLENLGLETIDLMYLHNAPESQLPAIGRKEFMQRLKLAFEFYEKARADGRIRYYGMATWNAFRVMPTDDNQYLNLQTAFSLAHEVGGEKHGFRFIQLPFNLAFAEAVTMQGQPITMDGDVYQLSTLEAAMSMGVGVFTSVPLLQGQLLTQDRLPNFDNLDTPAQKCLQFIRSHPGIIAPLVGHKQPEHVKDNLKAASVPPLEFKALQDLLAVKA